jgi:ribosome-associated toxin RatA of RatAB toxin-antitoxin module
MAAAAPVVAFTADISNDSKNMTTIERSALVAHPVAAMYQLVNDIEAYPQFMEGCVGAQVLQRTPELIDARLDLSKGGIKYSFTTRNRLLPPQRIELTLLEGPFDKFSGCWSFQELSPQACKVTLHLDFEMSGKLLGLAVKTLFNSVANQLVDALVKRANHIYGQ